MGGDPLDAEDLVAARGELAAVGPAHLDHGTGVGHRPVVLEMEAPLGNAELPALEIGQPVPGQTPGAGAVRVKRDGHAPSLRTPTTETPRRVGRRQAPPSAYAGAVVPAPPDLVIFDCDGVLVDSEPISNAVLARLLTR